MSDTPPQPDSKRLFDLLLGVKMEPGNAYTFIQEVGNMAAANLIARFESKLDAQIALFESKFDAQIALFESKLDAQNALFESRFDAQNAKLDALQVHLRRERAMLWAVIALLGAAVLRYIVVG